MIEEFETKKLTKEILQNYIESLYDLNDKIVLFPEGFLVANTTKYFNDLYRINKEDINKYKFIDFKTGKPINAMNIYDESESYYHIYINHEREYSQKYNHNFATADKFSDSTICNGIKSHLWEGCSTRKFGMFVVYKNENDKVLYGVIDDKGNFLVNFKEYVKVELLTNYNVYLTDKNNNSYIYSKKYGLNKIEINKRIIKLELSKDFPYYIITINDDKYGELKGLINNKGEILLEPIYKQIYMNNKNMIYGMDCINDNKKHIFNSKIQEIMTIDADILLFFDNYIIYQKNNQIFVIDLNTMDNTYFNLSYLKDEFDKYFNLDELRTKSDKQLESLVKKYPYYEEDLGHIILHKTKKYGIKLTSEINNKSYKRYFKNKDQLEKIEKYIGDIFLQNNIVDKTNKLKTLKKGE